MLTQYRHSFTFTHTHSISETKTNTNKYPKRFACSNKHKIVKINRALKTNKNHKHILTNNVMYPKTN